MENLPSSQYRQYIDTLNNFAKLEDEVSQEDFGYTFYIQRIICEFMNIFEFASVVERAGETNNKQSTFLSSK